MPTIKILIAGEGSTDYGGPDGFGNWNPGPVMRLLERMLPDYELCFEPVMKTDLNQIKGYGGKGLTGHSLNVNKIIKYAKATKKEFDYLLYFADTDRESSTKNNEMSARKASREAYEEAETAFGLYPDVKGIAMIPLRMIESWLISDQSALESVIRRRLPRNVQIAGNPEMLWGNKTNPDSNYPKHALGRILDLAGMECNRESFLEIVDHIDYCVLLSQCPISFTPFVKQLVDFGFLAEPVCS